MKSILISGLVTLTFLSGCINNDQPETSSENDQPVEQHETDNGIEVVADNLYIPWSIDKFEETV